MTQYASRQSAVSAALLLLGIWLSGCGQQSAPAAPAKPSAPASSVSSAKPVLEAQSWLEASRVPAPAPVQAKPNIPAPTRLGNAQLNVVGLSIEPGAVLLTGSGQTQILRALNRDAQGNPLSLENRNLEWRTSNPDKVSITPLSTPVPTLEGRRFILSAWGKLDAPNTGPESCFVGVKLKNPQGQETTPGLIVESTAYAQQSTVITVPAGYSLGEVFVSNGSNTRCTLDDLSLVAAQAATVAPETNLLTNPGLEQGLTGWGIAGNANFTLEPGQGRAGSTALAVSSNGGRGQIYSDLRANTAYSVKVWGKLEGAGGDCKLGYKLRNAAGQIQEESTPITGQDYAQYSLNLTTPANPEQLEVYVWNGGNGRCFADDFSLTTSSLSTAWNPYGSELLQNGGFESDLQSWDSFGPQANLELVGEAYAGSKALRLNTNKAGQGQFVTNLGTEPPRSSTNDVVLVTALTDSGASGITVKLRDQPDVRSSAASVTIARLKTGVQQISSSEIVVPPSSLAGGGSFSAAEVAGYTDFPKAAVVLRRSAPAVGTLLALETPERGMGRVAQVQQRGEYSLVQLEVAGPEALFENYNASYTLTNALETVGPAPLSAASRPVTGKSSGNLSALSKRTFTVPIGGNLALECEGNLPDGLNTDALIKNEDFTLNPKFEVVNKAEGGETLLGGGLQISPTGGFALGIEGDLKASLSCLLKGLPVLPITIPVPTPVGPIPVPTSINFTPNLALTVDASKSPQLRVAWTIDRAQIAFQAVVRFKDWLPQGVLPYVVEELGTAKEIDWTQYREKFKPEWQFLRGAITGLLPATVSVSLRPIGVNIAWGSLAFGIPRNVPVIGGREIPQFDLLNVDINAFDTNLTWAAPGYAVQEKVSPGRFNINYLSGVVAARSKTLEAGLEQLPPVIKQKAQKFFNDLFERLSVKIGQNFGQARFVPTVPSKAYISVNKGEIIELDGSREIFLQPLDNVDLVLEPKAGDPNTTGDLLSTQLEVSNATRYSSLVSRGQVWDWTHVDDVSKQQLVPFAYSGVDGLRSIRLAVPGQVPGTLPIEKDFRVAGGYNVTFEMCDQIASKGGSEWRFSGDSRLLGVSEFTTANYLGSVKVNCGIDAKFRVNGLELPEDGQNVTVEDCKIPTPFEIEVLARATLRGLSVQLDGQVFGTRDELLGGSNWPARGDRKLREGEHTLEVTGKSNGADKEQKAKRSFTVTCKFKDPILPAMNEPVFTAKGKTLPSPEKIRVGVCPQDNGKAAVNLNVDYRPNTTGGNVFTVLSYQFTIAQEPPAIYSSTLDDLDPGGVDRVSSSASPKLGSGKYTLTFFVKVFVSLLPSGNNKRDYLFQRSLEVETYPKTPLECGTPDPNPNPDPKDGGATNPKPKPKPNCPPKSGPYALAAASSKKCRDDSNSGEPHLVTKDGLRYDFQAVGEFVFTRSSVPDMPFEVQTRYKPYGTSLALTSAVAARVGTDRVSALSRSGTQLEVKVNGVLVVVDPSAPTERTLADGGKLSVQADGMELVWKDGSTLTIHNIAYQDKFEGNREGGYLNFEMETHPRHEGLTLGLSGNFNGDPTDDLTTRSGQVLPPQPSFEQLYKEYGSSWRVTQSESLFDYAPGESTLTFSDLNFPASPPPVLTEAQRTAAQVPCKAAGITDPAVLENCAYDVAVSGDPSFAQAAAQSDRNADTIALNPTSVQMTKGGSRIFNATLPAGRAGAEVVWTATGGTVIRVSNSAATYTAPETPGSYTLSARAENGAAVATSSVQVVDQNLPTLQVSGTVKTAEGQPLPNVGLKVNAPGTLGVADRLLYTDPQGNYSLSFPYPAGTSSANLTIEASNVFARTLKTIKEPLTAGTVVRTQDFVLPTVQSRTQPTSTATVAASSDQNRLLARNGTVYILEIPSGSSGKVVTATTLEGAVEWSLPITTEYLNRVLLSPAQDLLLIYGNDSGGRLVIAVNTTGPDKGKQRWAVNVPDGNTVQSIRFGKDGTIFLLQSNTGVTLSALEPATGTVRWSKQVFDKYSGNGSYMAVGQASNRVYVRQYGGGDVKVLEGGSGAVLPNLAATNGYVLRGFVGATASNDGLLLITGQNDNERGTKYLYSPTTGLEVNIPGFAPQENAFDDGSDSNNGYATLPSSFNNGQFYVRDGIGQLSSDHYSGNLSAVNTEAQVIWTRSVCSQAQGATPDPIFTCPLDLALQGSSTSVSGSLIGQDKDHNLYLSVSNGQDYQVASVDPRGKTRWVTSLVGNPQGGKADRQDAKVDTDGWVYINLSEYATTGINLGKTLLALNPAGLVTWSYRGQVGASLSLLGTQEGRIYLIGGTNSNFTQLLNFTRCSTVLEGGASRTVLQRSTSCNQTATCSRFPPCSPSPSP